MKKLIVLVAFILTLYFVYGCNKKYETVTNDCIGGGCIENDTDTTNNTNNPDPEVDDEEEETGLSLEGYYEMPFSGFIEIVELNDGRYLVYQQQIFSQNNDGGIAYHPNMSVGPHVPKANGTIVYAQNLTYSDVTHDVEEDGGNRNIDGARRTEYVLRINEETGRFEYEVTIREDTTLVGDIEVHRILEEE